VTASAPIDTVTAAAYRVPTDDAVESDGTLEWRSTDVVVAHVSAEGQVGLG